MTGFAAASGSMLGARVLLVEDDEAHRHLVRHAFSSRAEGVQLTCVRTLQEAREVLACETPDVVLTDLILPDGKGIDLLHDDLDEARFCVVVMTSYGDEREAVAALKAGAQDYVVKSAHAFTDMPRICNRALTSWSNLVERRRAEEALRESESRYRTLVENAPEAILVLDTDTRRFVDANGNAAALFKLSRSELLRLGPDQLSAPQQAAVDGNPSWAVDEALAGGTPVFECVHRDAEGRDFPCEIRLVRLPSLEGPRVRGSVTDITERKKIEEQLKDYSGRLQSVSQRLLEAQEAERAHLARELHDQVGQSLTALKINLQSCRDRAAVADVGRALDEGIDIIDTVLGQVRNLSLGLRPPMLDDLGLVTALRWFVKSQARLGGFGATLVTSLGEDQRLAPALETVCFRIVQEAMTNIERHAHASEVRVTLNHSDGLLTLRIEDDGVGFDVEHKMGASARGDSFGLVSMQERALLVGGQVKVESTFGAGTNILAIFRGGLSAPTPAAFSSPQSGARAGGQGSESA